MTQEKERMNKIKILLAQYSPTVGCLCPCLEALPQLSIWFLPHPLKSAQYHNQVDLNLTCLKLQSTNPFTTTPLHSSVSSILLSTHISCDLSVYYTLP
jgi:hypothetical protein